MRATAWITALAAAACTTVAASTPSVGRWAAAGIASAEFESHPAFDPRDRAVFFTRSSPTFRGWRLMVSRCRDGRWTPPRPAPFAGDGLEADPFIERGGRTLWFISTRSEGGVKQKELDIWRVRRSRAGEWGAPERLPEPVNSPGSEWFPRPAADGWLYFGSDRPGGQGGTDIWRARQDRHGRWTAENLGPEVNGPGDDYEAELSPHGRRMVVMADGDLWETRRAGAAWSPRRKLGPEVNTAALEVGPLFSPSGRSLIFARDLGADAGAGELLVRRERAERWPPACA